MTIDISRIETEVTPISRIVTGVVKIFKQCLVSTTIWLVYIYTFPDISEITSRVVTGMVTFFHIWD